MRGERERENINVAMHMIEFGDGIHVFCYVAFPF